MNSNNFSHHFCGSTFWDSSLTWYTDHPELTACFERIVLEWIPAIFLIIFTPLECYFMKKSRESNIPYSLINVGKLIMTSCLILISVLNFIVVLHRYAVDNQIYTAEYLTPFVKMFAFSLSAFLVYYNRIHGIRSSGILFTFWLLCVIASLPILRSVVIKWIQGDTHLYNYVTTIIYCIIVWNIFILNWFPDSAPRDTPFKDYKKVSPVKSSGFPSRLTFNWFNPMAWIGFRRPITQDDLWNLNPEDTSAEVVKRFEKFWKRNQDKYNRKHEAKATYTNKSMTVNIVNKNNQKKYVSILPALIKSCGMQFLGGSVLRLAFDLLSFTSPQLLSALISFVQGDAPMWHGYLYAIMFFVVALLQSFCFSHYMYRMTMVGMKVKTALCGAIYKKALSMSPAAKNDISVGQIVNLMAIDAHKFQEIMPWVNMVWSDVLQISLALYFLWRELGGAVFAGFAVMIILIPINGIIMVCVKRLQMNLMKQKDKRSKLMNELFNGIKVIKMYAWEPSFQEQVSNIRNEEVKIMRKIAVFHTLIAFNVHCAPFIVSIVSFGTYVSIDENNILDTKKAFVSLLLFNMLRMPLSMLPMVISSVVQALVSIKRLNKFMNSDELNEGDVEHNTDETNPLIVENGTFSWMESEQPVLRDINLSIKKGSLVAVVGSVGSGKTSLVSALLGEMNKVSGRVNTKGTIAYVPQQAWIQNASLKDNILFGHDYDKIKYNNIIDRCALKTDLEILPGGDETEIGEKGINLSGGQKQRVSLARAVYADCDNYFLDDPLSAVDAHVGKHIFDQVIGPSGALHDKTRVWVTHNITFLPQTDYVIVLKDGVVSEAGTYKELLDKKGLFAEFLMTYLIEHDDTEIKQALENKMGDEFHAKLEYVRSSSVHSTERVEEFAGDKKKNIINTQMSNGDIEAKEIKKFIEAEKTETGQVKWSVYNYYMRYIGVLYVIGVIVTTFGFQGFQIASNFWLDIWSKDENNDANGKYLGVYGALGIAQVICTTVGSLLLFFGTLFAAKTLHVLLLDRVLKAPTTSFFDVTPIGRILNKFSKDIDVLDTVLPMSLRQWSSCLAQAVGCFLVICIVTPVLVALIIPLGVLYYFIQKFYVAISRQLKRLESITRSPIYSHFSESIAGASSIRAYGVKDRFIIQSQSTIDRNQMCYYPSVSADRWLAIRLELMANFITFFTALIAVINRDGPSGQLVGLSISYALQITQTLNWLVRMTSEVETNVVAVERIKEYSEVEQEAPWEVPDHNPPKDWPQNGNVELTNLTLGYRSDTESVIKGITCSIKARQKVGIVGRTGAGKSTLTLGMFRIMEPRDGTICIDNVNITVLGLHSLRSRITVIPQEPVLFSGSLRFNLDPFSEKTDAEIWRALKMSHLDSFASSQPAGLEHEIAEGGGNLSAGQRQLVCLARALLRKTKLLILDEATAAVDLETDHLVQQTIRQEFNDSTILTIAHRLDTVADYDKIMVLDKGYLVEYDTPQNLLANKKSQYYSMAKNAGIVS